MTAEFIIAVTAKDQPGIIATITEAVFELGGNVTELSQTVMSGYFTLILRADLPAHTDPATIKRRIEGARPELGLAVHVRPYESQPLFVPEEHTGVYFLTVQGPDRPGLIAEITTFLAAHQINIEDLYTRSEGDTITMIFQIQPRTCQGAVQLRQHLAPLGKKLGVAVHLLHQDILRATSEVGAIRRLVRGGTCP